MMKKLITTLLILFSLASQAQTYKYLTIPGETGKVRGAVVIDGITMLSSIDTLPVPITMRDMHGLIGKGDSLYRYSPVQHKWIPISGGGASVWGSITGLLSNQTDLQTALNNKQNKLLQGTPAQYFRGDLSLGTFATDVLSLTNSLYAPIAHTHDGLLPIGGAKGYVLRKRTPTDYDVDWYPVDSISPVSSVFGRTGAVIAQPGDYSAFYPTKQQLTDSALRIWDKLNNIGFNVNNDNFKVTPPGPFVGDKYNLDLSDAILDKINEVTTPGNLVPYPDFIDTTNNLRDAIAAVWANFSNYYTKTESDARFYPLDLNPKGYLTAVPATDDPYRIDSTKILGEDNPRTLTNYYHNGSTSSTNYIDFKSDYWRKNASGDLYHLETNGTGFVGIGTNAPAASIHVAASYSIGSVAGFLLEDKTTPGAFLKLMDGTASSSSMVPVVWGRGVDGVLTHAINNNNRDGLQVIGEIGYDTTFNAGVTIIGRNHTGGTLLKAPPLRVVSNLGTVATFNADSTVTFNYLKLGRTIPTQPGTPRSVVVYDNGTFSVGAGDGSSATPTTADNGLSITGSTIKTSKGWDTVSYAATVTLNVANKKLSKTLTLAGNTTVSFTGGQDGDIVYLELIQDATGGRTVTWESRVDWSRTTTETAPTIKSGANKAQTITLIYKLSANKWYGFY